MPRATERWRRSASRGSLNYRGLFEVIISKQITTLKPTGPYKFGITLQSHLIFMYTASLSKFYTIYRHLVINQKLQTLMWKSSTI